MKASRLLYIGEIIINRAYMYLANLLPKRFRLSASSEAYKQQKMKKLSKIYTLYKKNIYIKKDDSKNKTEQSSPLCGDHGSQIMKLKWLTPEFILFS